jgi:hypothetical protein
MGAHERHDTKHRDTEVVPEEQPRPRGSWGGAGGFHRGIRCVRLSPRAGRRPQATPRSAARSAHAGKPRTGSAGPPATRPGAAVGRTTAPPTYETGPSRQGSVRIKVAYGLARAKRTDGAPLGRFCGIALSGLAAEDAFPPQPQGPSSQGNEPVEARYPLDFCGVTIKRGGLPELVPEDFARRSRRRRAIFAASASRSSGLYGLRCGSLPSSANMSATRPSRSVGSMLFSPSGPASARNSSTQECGRSSDVHVVATLGRSPPRDR